MTSCSFLTYATGSFVPGAQALCESARAVGFDRALALGPDDLDPDFRRDNAALLSEPRGAGYWLWKPQVILQELGSLQPGEVLVYSDAGRNPYYRLRQFPTQLVAKTRARGFLLGPAIPQHGPISRWCKRDAFILTGMDQPEIAARPCIQATWSLWTNCAAARQFLKLWIDVSRDPRALSDQASELGDNYPGFRDHRHDQALMSLIAYREAAPHLDYTSRGLYRILAMRSKSALAHLFLKRIDDAEKMERRRMIPALARAFRDLRRERKVGT